MANLWIISIVVKKLILTIFANFFIAFMKGQTFRGLDSSNFVDITLFIFFIIFSICSGFTSSLLILVTSVFSLFSWSVWLEVSHFYWSQRTSFWFYWFPLLVSISLISYLIFISFFLVIIFSLIYFYGFSLFKKISWNCCFKCTFIF